MIVWIISFKFDSFFMERNELYLFAWELFAVAFLQDCASNFHWNYGLSILFFFCDIFNVSVLYSIEFCHPSKELDLVREDWEIEGAELKFWDLFFYLFLLLFIILFYFLFLLLLRFFLSLFLFLHFRIEELPDWAGFDLSFRLWVPEWGHFCFLYGIEG